MKNVIKSSIIAGIILIFGVQIYNNLTPKAWADAQSLPQQKPLGADIDQLFRGSQPYASNWQSIVQYTISGVNWVAIGFPAPAGSTGGAVNWTYPNAYIGG